MSFEFQITLATETIGDPPFRVCKEGVCEFQQCKSTWDGDVDGYCVKSGWCEDVGLYTVPTPKCPIYALPDGEYVFDAKREEG
jgi:hypothetical protein